MEKPQISRCVHCGNNPIPHGLTWFNETITVMMTPVSGRLMGSLTGKRAFKLLSVIFTPLLRLLERLGLLTYGDKPTDKTSSRAEVLWEEARRRGIKMQSVIVFGRENDSYRAFIKDKVIYFTGLPRPEYLRGSAEWWMDDKARLRKKLEHAGIPMARGGCFTSFRNMKKLFKQIEKPVIVKPRLGSRGRHTTTFIYTEEQLKEAFRIAKQLCRWVIMEEHLTGSVDRGTVIGGKMIGMLGGDPPRITADGAHTIRELIELKNRSKPEGIHDVLISPAMEIFLGRSSYTIDTVLPAGKRIDLSEKIGVRYGGNSWEAIDTTHPEIIQALESAAAVVGDPMLGFDFIIEDHTKSPQDQKWGIIECNGLPFINLHHDPIEGTPINAAKHVWDYVEDNLKYY